VNDEPRNVNETHQATLRTTNGSPIEQESFSVLGDAVCEVAKFGAQDLDVVRVMSAKAERCD
jgi:hypothetical protein